MGEALEIVKTLVSPTEKLTNSVKNAIGIMYEPRHIKKMADAKAYEINTIGKALRENNDVIITYEKGSIIASLPEFEEFAKRTQYRLLSRELKNQYNIESIIGYAYEDLETESQTTDEDIDEDWIIRLFNIAKDVSNEDMQFVWGKILAGEIKCPGSFSLRTLDVVRNLSQKEAKTFQKILPLIIVNDEDYFIISKASIYEKYGVTYDDIMLLDECGLVVSNGTVSLTIPISNDSVIAHNKKYAIVSDDLKREKDFSFGIYSLTQAGKELLNILEYEPNNEYFNDFAECIFKENKYSALKIQPIESIRGSIVRTTGETVREFCFSQKR